MLNFSKHNNKRKDVLSVGSRSDVGLVRTENQDSFGVFSFAGINGADERLFVVADGMGGHEHGCEASTMAVSTLGTGFGGNPETGPDIRLQQMFELANEQIYARSQQIGEGTVMGTTCTAVALSKNRFWIAHVGDSRIYRIDQDSMTQITEDHTVINELLRDGLLSREEAEDDPRKHHLVQAMGVTLEIQPDIFEISGPENGERILICSDGLAVVPEEKIAKIIREQDVQQACDELVALANRNGGPDNTTVVIIGLS